MTEFAFVTDADSQAYCEQIVRRLCEGMSISESEAVQRLNHHWARLGTIVGDDNVIYHRDPDDWARIVYYGFVDRWWDRTTDLAPRPLPVSG